MGQKSWEPTTIQHCNNHLDTECSSQRAHRWSNYVWNEFPVTMISTLATDKQVVRFDTSRMYRAGKHRFQFPLSRRQIGNQICCPSNGTNTNGLRAVRYSISGGIEHPKQLAQWRPDRFATIIRSNERVDIRRRPLPPTPAATIFTEGRAACASSAAGLNIKRWLRRRRLTSVIAGCCCCYYGCSLNFPHSDVWLSRTLESLLCRLVFPPELTSPNAVTFVQRYIPSGTHSLRRTVLKSPSLA